MSERTGPVDRQLDGPLAVVRMDETMGEREGYCVCRLVAEGLFDAIGDPGSPDGESSFRRPRAWLGRTDHC